MQIPYESGSGYPVIRTSFEVCWDRAFRRIGFLLDLGYTRRWGTRATRSAAHSESCAACLQHCRNGRIFSSSGVLNRLGVRPRALSGGRRPAKRDRCPGRSAGARRPRRARGTAPTKPARPSLRARAALSRRRSRRRRSHRSRRRSLRGSRSRPSASRSPTSRRLRRTRSSTRSRSRCLRAPARPSATSRCA